MKLTSLHEATKTNLALDIIGLIPGAEAADVANAILHINQKEYFQAAMSLLSMIPAVGDAIGKSAKYLGKNNKGMEKFLATYGDDIARNWPKIKKHISKIKELEPHMPYLDAAVAQALTIWQRDNARPNRNIPPVPTN